MNTEKERRRIKYTSRPKGNTWEESEKLLFRGLKKGITLLEGSHVFYARLSDKSALKIKTPEWW